MKNVVYAVVALVAWEGAAAAQTKPQPAPAAVAPATAPPAAKAAEAAQAARPTPADPVNVRYEIVIREVGSASKSAKSVTVTIALADPSSIRAQGTSAGRGNNPLALDITPLVIRDGKIRTRISFEYTPAPPEGSQGPPPFFTRQTLNLWLDNGKPMVVSEAEDPISDRRFTVSVTATIQR
jgi:hypothetical protein